MNVKVGEYPSAGKVEKRGNGKFSRKIMDGEFAISVEMPPPRGTAPGILRSKLDFVRNLAESGLVDAVDMTDGSRGVPAMPPGDFISVVRSQLGPVAQSVELIPHFATRDLNTMAMQARLIGYHATGIHTVLFVTGDPPEMPPAYPCSTAVFDLDSTSLIKQTHEHLNAGVDFGGKPLGQQKDPRTHFTIGTGFEPDAVDMERQLSRLGRKVEYGADFVMTQPVFTMDALSVLKPYLGRIAVMAGVLVLNSFEHARRMHEMPGISVSEAVFERLGRFKEAESQSKEAADIAIELIREAKAAGWPGVYLMAPTGHERAIRVLTAGLS